MSQDCQGQDQGAGAGARAAGSNDRLRKVDPGGLDSAAELVVWKDRAVGLDQLGKRKVPAPRHVAAAKAGSRLGLSGGKAPGRTDVHQLLSLMLDVGLNCGEISHRSQVQPGGELAPRECHRARLDRPVLPTPFSHAAIQHGRALVPEGSQHPPDPRRTEIVPGSVVHDQIVGVIQPERAHSVREGLLGGKHVRQSGIGIAAGVEIEEHCAGNMAGHVFGGRVATAAGQVPGRVDDPETRGAQSCRQPLGRYHGRELAGHGSSNTLPVVRRPSSSRWASAAAARGNSRPMRTSSVPSATDPNTAEARSSNSARVTM